MIITYLTHNNGSRPFKVIINDLNNNIKVYNNYNNELIFEKIVKRFLIGRTLYNKMTQFSGGYGRNFDGSSILLKLDDNLYQYIGESIFTFNTYNEIVDFKSPVGNNDVPYPYATDTDGNIYLMIENVVLINTDFFRDNYKKYDDPYDYYYKNCLITNDLGTVPHTIPEIRKYNDFKEFNQIKEYKINNENYTLTYTPNPENIYKDSMYILYYDDNLNIITKNFTKEEYINFHDRFGLLIGFRPILNKVIDQDRL